jgi:MSHA biogenesis protein MshI
LRVRDLPFLARRPRPCAGLYLSGSTVALAVAEPGGERVGCAAEPLTDVAACSDVLADLVRRLGAQRANCVLTIAPDSYHLMLIERPNVPDGELRDAARWRVQEYLEFPAVDAVIDVFPFPEAATRGRTPMVYVVASARERIETAVRLVTQAGLAPVCVDIAELTLRNLVHRIYPSAEHSIALLRLTPAGGIVNVTRGDELFLSRRISGVPVAFDEATWDSFKDTLLLQVQRSIDYYESALSQPQANCLLVASSHGWHERIVAHLESMLPLPVRSLGSVLPDALAIDVFDPQPRRLAATQLSDADDAALVAALPAVGAALRAAAYAEAAA